MSFSRFSSSIDVLHPSEILLVSIFQYEKGNYEIQTFEERGVQMERFFPEDFIYDSCRRTEETEQLKNYVTPEYIKMERQLRGRFNGETIEDYCDTVTCWTRDMLTRNYIPYAFGWSNSLNGRYANFFRGYKVTHTYDEIPIYLVLHSKGTQLAFLGVGAKEDLFTTETVYRERSPHPTLLFSLSDKLIATLKQYENKQYETQDYDTRMSQIMEQYNFGYEEFLKTGSSILVTENFLEQEKQFFLESSHRATGTYHCRICDCFYKHLRSPYPSFGDWTKAVQGLCDEKYKDYKIVLFNDPWPLYFVFKDGEDYFVPLGVGTLNHCFSFNVNPEQ